MAFSNYSELQATIGRWLDKQHLGDAIKDFIRLGEKRLCGEASFDPIWLGKIATITVERDAIDFPLPDDFNGIRTLKLNTNPVRRLSYVTPDHSLFLNLENHNRGLSTNFTIVGNRLRVLPAPPLNATLQMVYTFAPECLSDTNTTNIFLEKAYDALLYASLLEAKPYVKDNKRIDTWMTYYKEAINNMINRDEGNKYGDSPLSMSTEYGAMSAPVRQG